MGEPFGCEAGTVALRCLCCRDSQVCLMLLHVFVRITAKHKQGCVLSSPAAGRFGDHAECILDSQSVMPGLHVMPCMLYPGWGYTLV